MKEKVATLPLTPTENPGEASAGSLSHCCQCLTSTRLMSASRPPGILARDLCWSLLPSLESLLLPAMSLLETSLTQSRLPSQSWDLHRWLAQGWSGSRLLLTRLPSLCPSNSPRCWVDIATPEPQPGSSLCGSAVADVAPASGSTTWRSAWSLLCRDAEDLEKQVRTTVRKAVTEEEFLTLAMKGYYSPKFPLSLRPKIMWLTVKTLMSLLQLKEGSVQFSHPVVSNSLWPHGLQHARLPCPSTTPGAYLSSRPLSRWCHPTISSSVIPFFSRLQSFSASGSFPVSQFFASGLLIQPTLLMAPLNPVLAESFLRRPYRKDTKAGVLASNTSGFQFSSVQSLSHVWLQLHELQHAKLPCPSSSPWVCSNSWPLSWWCHPTILSCVVPFSCLQSFPASGSFPMSQFFISGGQSLKLQLQHQTFQWTVRVGVL